MKHSRFGKLFTALAAAALLLGACAPAATPAPTAAPTTAPQPTTAPEPTVAPTSAAEPVTLNIMHNYAPDDAKGPVLAEVIADFTAANPDVKIETEVFSDRDIPTKVETAFAAGTEPDIVFNNYAGSKRTWPDAGVTIVVNDLMKEWGLLDTFSPLALETATDAQGRMVGFPLDGFTWPMWYNTEILDKAGVKVPTTIDELIDASAKIRAAGFEPLVIGGKDDTGYGLFTIITQVPMTDEKMIEIYGEGKFHDPVAQEGLKLFTKLRDAGVFAKNSEGLTGGAMTEMFFAGKAAMMHGGSWFFGSLPEELQDKVVLGGFPISPDSPHKKPMIYAGYGKAVWITRNGAKKMDAVERFIKFLFKGETIAKFVERSGMTSPLKSTPVNEANVSKFIASSGKYVENVEVVKLTDNNVPQDQFEALYRATADAYIPGTTVDTIAEELEAIYR
jgi:multiple sugar transport system substrate-binding protein